MMTFHEENTNEMEIVACENLVPKDHLVRKLKKAIDFTFIYDIVRPYYSEFEGRPSIDPVILFKILFIKYIFGIKSVRQTIKDIEVNVAYRWFLGLSLNEKVPHFTLINTNYYRRFKETTIFEQIFYKILDKAIAEHMVNMNEIYIDSTHVKASANKHKLIQETVESEKKAYEDELIKDINIDRGHHGKEPFEASKKKDKVTKKISKIDSESGYYVKGEKEKCFAYSASIAVDNKGFTLGVHVAPGNVHDSQSFKGIYDKVIDRFDEDIIAVTLDAGYKTPGVAKHIIDSNKLPILPYRRPMTGKGFFKKYEFNYHKNEDVEYYVCPNNQKLHYTTTTREGYKQFVSDSDKCKVCPFLNQCTKSKNNQKVILRHIWQESLDYADELRFSDYHYQVYKKRKETVEREFGDGKENFTLRYTRYKGIRKNQNYLSLLFACQNLKKLALWTDNKLKNQAI